MKTYTFAELTTKQSGYVPCKCRDCMEIAIADDMSEGAFCHECEDAGCEEDGECQCADAYGCDDEEENDNG